jgi:hypothetical protein
MAAFSVAHLLTTQHLYAGAFYEPVSLQEVDLFADWIAILPQSQD